MREKCCGIAYKKKTDRTQYDKWSSNKAFWVILNCKRNAFPVNEKLFAQFPWVLTGKIICVYG